MTVAQAARFLRPPGWFHRRFNGEKLRRTNFQVGDSPVSRMLQRREKAKKFSDIPEARIVPQPKSLSHVDPFKRSKMLSSSVPSVSPEVLEKRLQFLLSDAAIKQQTDAPMRAGLTAYQTELFVWERQMREIRKIYRAQYLQTLHRVTVEEAIRERRLLDERQNLKKKTKIEAIAKRGMELKRRAILADQKRIEGKVNEALEVARRVKVKSRRLRFLNKIVEGVNESAKLRKSVDVKTSNETSNRFPVSDEEFLGPDVSMTLLAGQLGAGKEKVSEKSRQMHRSKNLFREVLERSYEIMPENQEYQNASIFSDNVLKTEGVNSVSDLASKNPPTELSPEERADLYYANFSPDEKLELIEQKIAMLERRIRAEDMKGDTDPLSQQLLDILTAAKAAKLEEENVAIFKANETRDDLK